MIPLGCAFCKSKSQIFVSDFDGMIICFQCCRKLQNGIRDLMGDAFIDGFYNTPRGFFHMISPDQMWLRRDGAYSSIDYTGYAKERSDHGERVITRHSGPPL